MVRGSGNGISYEQQPPDQQRVMEFANDSGKPHRTRDKDGFVRRRAQLRNSGGVVETVLTDLNMDANGQKRYDVDSGTLRTNSIGTWSSSNGDKSSIRGRYVSASSTAAAAASRSRSTGR